jgi:hypothetical protein
MNEITKSKPFNFSYAMPNVIEGGGGRGHLFPIFGVIIVGNNVI